MSFQQKDKSLIDITKEKSYAYSIKCKAYYLIYRHEKIVTTKQIQKYIVEWNHNVLCHLGETRNKFTIAQHFYWEGLIKSVRDICSKCHMCQFLKRGKRNYNRIPHKQAET